MRASKPASAGAELRQKIVQAVASIRKKGINYPNPRLDPALQELLGISDSTPRVQAQSRVRQALVVSAGRLQDPNLSAVFLLAAGLRGDPGRTTGERIKEAATSLSMSQETVYRMLREATEGIADQLLSQHSAPALEERDFIILRQTCTLDLRSHMPVVSMERTILAHRDGLGHFDELMSLPRLKAQKLDYRGIEGCSVEAPAPLGQGVWSNRLRFPELIRAGDQHTFAVSLRLPNHDSLEPVIGFTPVTPSMQGGVQLLFGDHKPARLTMHRDMVAMGMFVETSNAEVITPIEGEHRLVFRDMKPGFSYAVRWEWDGNEPRL